MTFFKNIEEQVGNVTDLGYAHQEFYYGKKFELFRPDKSDIFAKVHNKDANSALAKIKSFVGIGNIDGMFVTDNYNRAHFTEGFLITQETEILAGDVLVFIGKGGIVRFKVESQSAIGYTTTMFKKFNLSAMN